MLAPAPWIQRFLEPSMLGDPWSVAGKCDRSAMVMAVRVYGTGWRGMGGWWLRMKVRASGLREDGVLLRFMRASPCQPSWWESSTASSGSARVVICDRGEA